MTSLPTSTSPKLTLSQKADLLRSVSIFFETPAEKLTEVAALLQEVRFKAGNVIFRKGDEGDSMYIVIDGRVCVHDGDMILNCLGKWEVFGEMAVLDPGFRSASVTAEEDTGLFRLDQKPFQNLLDSSSEVSAGIIRILCQRLRARVQDMAEDYEYMQQFACVTSAAVAVENGIYEPECLDTVAKRTDALGQLARVFQRMAREVYNREENLKRQVAELRIEIDEVKKARQVAEITETDYFLELQNKAYLLRNRSAGR